MQYNQWLVTVVLSILLVIANCLEQRYEGIQLSEYKSFRDVSLNEYEVKENTKELHLNFIVYATDSPCELPKVTVYVQYGSFPLVNPLNTTYPPNFYTSHESYDPVRPNMIEDWNLLESVTRSTAYMSRSLRYLNPRPGSYFTAAYINPSLQSDAAIRPKGLFGGKSCSYVLQSSMKYYISEELPPIIETETLAHFLVTNNQSQRLRYQVPANSQSLQFNFTCLTSSDNQSSQACEFLVKTRARETYCDNSNSSSCLVVVDDPDVATNGEIVVRSMSLVSNLSVLLTSEDARVFSLNLYQSQSSGYAFHYYDVNPDPKAMSYFDTTLGSSPVTVVFSVLPLIHNGGTLKYEIHADPNTQTGMLVYSCLSWGKINTTLEHLSNCSKEQHLTIDTLKEDRTARLYRPYPVAGRWFVSAVRECYSVVDNKTIPCPNNDTTLIKLNIDSEPCVDNSCSNQGQCYQYVRNYLQWSTCKCRAGYRGYGCTDDSKALTKSLQLATVLFLTLSNALFIISAVVALRYRWFTESLVYLFVLFSSTYYHACDNGTLYTLCIYRYDILQYCDFYGSLLAVWFTAMALAKISYKVRSVLHVLGVLGIMVGTQYTLDGLWNFVVPLILATIVLAISWIRMCKLKRSCYPKKRVWLMQVLPGTLCALVGVALYSFGETESNYYYTHSIWHMLMASAVCFLLPHTKKLQLKAALTALRNVFRHRTQDSSDLEMDSDEVVEAMSDDGLVADIRNH